MKIYILRLLVVMVSFSAMAQHSMKAKALLDEVSSKMSSYHDVYVQFDYKLENKAEDVQQDASGDATLKGDKYVVNFFETTQIFDGTKTYTIIPENEEVNIALAEAEEEGAITPSKFYSFYKEGYTYDLGTSKKINGKTIQYVKLVPIDTHSEITSVIVGIDKKAKQITTIKQIGANGTETTLTIKSLKPNQQVSDQKFVFDQEKYEDLGYIINN